MLNYYIIYDMTPYDEGNSKNIRMGIGKKNPNFNILQSQYDTSYIFYAPQSGDQSYHVDLATHEVFEMW